MIRVEEMKLFFTNKLEDLKNFHNELFESLMALSKVKRSGEYYENFSAFRQTQLKLIKHEEIFREVLKRFDSLDQDIIESLYMNLDILHEPLEDKFIKCIVLSNQVIKFEDNVSCIDIAKFDECVEILKELGTNLDKIINYEPLLNVKALKFYSIYDTIITNLGPREYKKWNYYMNISKRADLDSAESIELKNLIAEIVNAQFITGHFTAPERPFPFIAFSGPSFTGKTQQAFNLARERPVFYVTFSPRSYGLQDIYKPFVHVSHAFISHLQEDSEMLKDLSINLDATSLFYNQQVKLNTIGLIWRFIQLSQKFEFDGSENWMEFYVKGRGVSFEPLSLSMFWAKMKTLDSSELIRKYPIIFMDSFNNNRIQSMELLRNLSRLMVIPCILSSPNLSTHYMFDSSSTISPLNLIDPVWVYSVRKLPKASVTAIVENNGITYDGDSINVSEMLRMFNITSNEETENVLKKITDFFLDQSKTSLQGTSAFLFGYFANALNQQKDGNLDPIQIWNSLCTDLDNELRGMKLSAFNSNVAMFYSFRMFSLNQNLIEDGAITAKDVSESINRHFYYFGRSDDLRGVIPLGSNRETKELTLNGCPHKLSSHFSRVEDDFFTTMVLWKFTPQSPTVAKTVKINKDKLHDIIPYVAGEIPVQMIMAYWAIASASHQSFVGKTLAWDFLTVFIGHLYLTNEMFTFESNKTHNKLLRFLKNMEIPYMIPEASDILTIMLDGICNFGVCEWCPESNGIKFDIDYMGHRSYGLAVFTETAKKAVLRRHLTHSASSEIPITIMICNSLDTALRTGPLSGITGTRINVYSSFDHKIIPLIEVKNPSGVLIIIKSNLS